MSGARAPTDACRHGHRTSLASRLQSGRPHISAHKSTWAGLLEVYPWRSGPALHATNKMHNEVQLNDEATSAASISAFSLDCLRPPLPPFGLIDAVLIYCCLTSPALGNASAASGQLSRIPETPVAWTPARNRARRSTQRLDSSPPPTMIAHLRSDPCRDCESATIL